MDPGTHSGRAWPLTHSQINDDPVSGPTRSRRPKAMSSPSAASRPPEGPENSGSGCSQFPRPPAGSVAHQDSQDSVQSGAAAQTYCGDVIKLGSWLCKGRRHRRRLEGPRGRFPTLSPACGGHTAHTLPSLKTRLCARCLCRGAGSVHWRLGAQSCYWGYSFGHRLPVRMPALRRRQMFAINHIICTNNLGQPTSTTSPLRESFKGQVSRCQSRANLAGRPLCRLQLSFCPKRRS